MEQVSFQESKYICVCMVHIKKYQIIQGQTSFVYLATGCETYMLCNLVYLQNLGLAPIASVPGLWPLDGGEPGGK